MKHYALKLRVEPYGWTVYFCNNREASLAWMKKEEFGKETIDAWADKNHSGVTSEWPEDREIFIGLFENSDRGTLSHECVHAAMFILDGAGIPVYASNHEALAYLVGYLVREYHDAVSAKKTKRKKHV